MAGRKFSESNMCHPLSPFDLGTHVLAIKVPWDELVFGLDPLKIIKDLHLWEY